MFAQRRRFVNQVRRLVYVTTKDHAYTLEGWAQRLAQRGIDVTLMPYERLLPAPRVPAATYILTDFDRLSVSELQAAATVHERLTAHGLTVLNDPRLFTPRAALLKRLKHAGVNAFDCFLPVSGEWPDRFPVFLRTLAGHRGVLTDLLHDLDACREAWQAALTRGFTASDLAFIEFAATPTESGAYQKHAAYRIGDCIVRANTVNERHWMAKNGELGLATEAQYRQAQALAVAAHLCLGAACPPLALMASSMGGHTACQLLDALQPRALVLFCPAAYTPTAEHLPFGPAFQQTLRATTDFADALAWAALRRFRGRLLLVWGAEDAVIPPAVIQGYGLAAKAARSV